MFVYQALMPIDIFEGMTRVDDYIRNIKGFHPLLSYLSLQKFIVECFVNLKCCDTFWDGSISGNEIYISAIPLPLQMSARVLSFKQSNNGHSFIVSEFMLPEECSSHDEGFELKKITNKNHEKLMEVFEASIDLATDIIYMTLATDPNESKQIVEQYKTDIVELITPDPENKFDIRNYNHKK